MNSSMNERYSRQILLREIGKKGQEKLKDCSAVVVGIGALGSTISNNLVRMGVGKIIVVDKDVVGYNNLHRQMLFNENDIDRPKVIVAVEALRKINSEINCIPIQKDLNSGNVESIVCNGDIVIDGTDNLETRYILNDACIKNDIPWIYGGAIGTYGMTMSIVPKITACFRCLLPNVSIAASIPASDTVGVLPAIPVIIGSIQSVEAVKIMLKTKDFNRNLLAYDVWSHEFIQFKINKNKNCKCCGKHIYEFLDTKKKK